MDIINTKVRQPIDKALDKVIDWIVTMAKKLFAKAFGKEDKKDERTDEQKQADLDKAATEADACLADEDKSVEDVTAALAGIKSKYRMTRLDLVTDSSQDQEATYHIHAEINPTKNKPGHKKAKGMTPVSLEFKCYKKYDYAEYKDQVDGQMKGLNQLKIEKWEQNYADYQTFGRSVEGGISQEQLRDESARNLRRQAKRTTKFKP